MDDNTVEGEEMVLVDGGEGPAATSGVVGRGGGMNEEQSEQSVRTV
jgi:hypothetical protein